MISYNGKGPLTRTACFFTLKETEIIGRIHDPINKNEGIEIDFDEENAIKDYYAPSIENHHLFQLKYILEDTEYLTMQIASPHLYIGFDKSLLDLTPSQLLSKNSNPIKSNKINHSLLQNKEQISLGLDGFILIDKNSIDNIL